MDGVRTAPALTEAPASPEPPTAGVLRPLADWAFDYERMVLEGSGSPAQHERALHLFLHVIVPLVGHVRLCELAGEHASRLATGVVPSMRPSEGSPSTYESRVCGRLEMRAESEVGSGNL
jgi:hypothetical protein